MQLGRQRSRAIQLRNGTGTARAIWLDKVEGIELLGYVMRQA